MCRKIFVTGTGTDVGKTFVAALLIKKLRDAGLSAGYYKAAASGDEIENIPADAFYVKKFSGLTCDIKKFRFVFLHGVGLASFGGKNF